MHPDEIRQISLTNFADTSASFTIITGSGSAELMGNGQILNGWDPQQLKRYISYFTFIAFDEWVISLPEEEKKKIESAVPLWKIEVRTASGEPELLTLWEKTDLSGDSLKTDANRLYGKLTDNGQFFLVRYFDVDPILKKRSYFFTR
jgi:hypothetical protein